MSKEKLTRSRQSSGEVKFQTLFEKANDAIFLMTEDIFVDCNPKTEEIFACSREEILNSHPYDFSPEYQPDGQPSKEKALEYISAALDGKPQRFEWTHARLDGTEFDAEVSLNRIEIDSKVLLQAIVRDISERKKYEQQIEYQAKLLEGISDAVIAGDMDFVVTSWNRAAEKLYGWKASEVIGREISTILRVEFPSHSREEIRDHILEHGYWHGESIQYRKDGTRMVMDGNISLLTDAEGNPTGTVAINRDITEKEAATEALRLSEEKFRALTESTASAIFIYQDGQFKYVNNSMTQLTGYAKVELLNREFLKVVHPEYVDIVKTRSVSRLSGENAPNRYELKIVTKSGTEKWVDFTTTVIEYAGKPAGLGTAFEITGRKRGELVQSAIFRISEIVHTVETLEEVYKRIHEIIQDLMPAKNFYIALYDETEDMIHFPYFVDELTPSVESRPRQSGKGITEYVLKRDEPLLATNELLLSLVDQGEIEPYGEYSVDWLGVPLRTNHQVIGVMAVQSYDEGVRYTDREKNILNFISRQIAMTIARKHAESELARERQQLAVTLRSIADGVITTDTKGRIRLMNKMAEELTGWTEKDAKGKVLTEVFPLVNRTTKKPVDYSLNEVINHRRTVSLPPQTILMTRHGEELLIADSIAPLSDEESEVVGAVLVFRDETEKHQMEQELLKSRKLESVGTLAGGIAHDFNNILAGILGNISLAKLTSDDSEKLVDLLDNAERAAERASTLTNQLLTFSKGGAPVKETISILEIIKESVEFALHGSNVRYELNLSEDLWSVEVDPGQIDQVIHNIVINADQSMPSGGTIHVIGENYTIGSPSQLPPLRPGNYVRVSIADTGVGIPEEDIEKIFDPYFSTKDMGHGLGLATCYSIIQKHSGKIVVESEKDRGTTITIYLPAIAERVGTDISEPDISITHGEGRILVMDDDDTVLDLATEMLERLGYHTETANDGDEAVALYRKAAAQEEPFDIVLMDLTIAGGKGGKDAAQEILDFDPAATLVVSSGYSTDQVMSDYGDYGFAGKVAKPYSLKELSRAIDQVTGEK